MSDHKRIYSSLKDLLLRISGQLKSAFADSYWVKAEVAGVRTYGPHTYFNLIELQNGQNTAQVKVVAYSGEGIVAIQQFEQTTGQKLVDGIKIGARVKVSFHPLHGMSLVLCELDPELTLGGIELTRQQTLQTLLFKYPQVIQVRNGEYLTPNKALRLPVILQNIALISSPTSDGYQDFMHSLENNSLGYRFDVDLFAATVHGSSAGESIIDAFRKIYDSNKKYDSIVLIRGGGAPADFLPFDDHRLALVVAKARYPVITGIGHQANQGICDFFARVHRKTPTAAGEFLIQHNQLFENMVLQISNKIKERVRAILDVEANRQGTFIQHLNGNLRQLLKDKNRNLNDIVLSIQPAGSRLTTSEMNKLNQLRLRVGSSSTSLLQLIKFRLIEKQTVITLQPFRVLKAEEQKVSQMSAHFTARLPNVIKAHSTNLFRIQQNVNNLDPQNILKRGFALVRKNGTFITGSEALKKGDSLQIIQANAIIDTTINHIQKRNGTVADL
jgi:exodeoxyribonuclease VII large subunit